MAWCDAGDLLKERLQKKLEPVREARNSSPSVKMAAVGGACRGISFVVASPANLVPALAALVAKLSEAHPGLQVHAEPGRASELSIILPGGRGSVAVQQAEQHPLGAREAATEVVFYKEDGAFSEAELDAFVASYAAGAFTARFGHIPGGAGRSPWPTEPSARPPAGQSAQGQASRADPLARLEALGAVVYRESGAQGSSSTPVHLDWSCLAGYDAVRRDVEDTVLLGLKHPDEYDNVTRKTRARFESNRPRAVLFEGPPGTGKTTTARIVASLAGVPMVYIPIESVMSKWFGESESRLSEILATCDELGSAIVFLDEIDSLATSRDSGGSMHEATRRLLSVLLRTLDGFQERTGAIVIAATNRQQDLDAALVSRFDVTVPFPLPGLDARVAIFARYAVQLGPQERLDLARATEGFSGRDIKDACKAAERRWVSEQLRSAGEPGSGALEISAPPVACYRDAVSQRKSQVQK